MLGIRRIRGVGGGEGAVEIGGFMEEEGEGDYRGGMFYRGGE